MRRSFLSTPLWSLFQLLPSGFCFESLPWLSFVMDCKLKDETNPFFQMLLLVVMFITVIGSNLGYYTLIPLSRVCEYARDPDDILIGRHTEKNIDRGSSNNSGRINDRSRVSHLQKLYIWHMEVGFLRENSRGGGRYIYPRKLQPFCQNWFPVWDHPLDVQKSASIYSVC